MIVTINKSSWEAISKAVANPIPYRRKSDRKPLRVAVDTALEQVTNELLGRGARSREQMIRGLNRLATKPSSQRIIKATLDVLNHYDDLEAYSYNDDEDEDDFKDYVQEILASFIDLTKHV